MTRIEVDYNERDTEGRVIGGVSADQLLTLHEGQTVTLWDPIDRLRADATVAWIEGDAHAVGFDVDWASVENGEFPAQEAVAPVASVKRSAPVSLGSQSVGPGTPTTPVRELATVSGVSDKVSVFSSHAVFISYRREDTASYARTLRAFLGQHLPSTPVFMDLDSVESGVDFAGTIESAVRASVVLVVLIGPKWLTSVDDEGRRRIDDPDDSVRFEIQAALQRRAQVIPVLVDGARAPRPQQLPDALRELARLSTLEMSSRRFEYDEDRLMRVIQKVLSSVTGDR